MSKSFPQPGWLPGSLAAGVLVSGGVSFLICWVSALFNFMQVVGSKKDDANLEEAKSYLGYYVLSAHYLTEEGLAARARLFFFFIAGIGFIASCAAGLSCIGTVFDLS